MVQKVKHVFKNSLHYSTSCVKDRANRKTCLCFVTKVYRQVISYPDLTLYDLPYDSGRSGYEINRQEDGFTSSSLNYLMPSS